jgi:hypothetical protein
MENNTAGFIAYVLYLCVQSHMTCDVVKDTWKSEKGIQHNIVQYSKMEGCKDHAGRLTNVEPDKEGRYFVEYNKWYECRQERPKSE